MTLTVLLAPGASATRDHSSLLAIEAALAGVAAVERIDLPSRRGVPGAIGIVREAAAGIGPDLVAGGRSFGGRVCSVAVADGLPARGLVLISYPLHPPGRPEQLRVEHFPRIGVPCLFVSGTRDAFGTPDELERATAGIPAMVDHVWLDGGNHGLRRRDGDVAAAVVAWVRRLASPPG